MAEAGKEGIWLTNLLRSIDLIDRNSPVKLILHGDSTSVIALSENATFHERTKHIQVRYHWLREQVRQGLIKLHHEPGHSLVADGMTKPLVKAKFDTFVSQLGFTTSL